MSQRVRDLMRPSLITCPANTTLGEAAAMLARYGIHALIVSDAAGMAEGIVSDVDLLAGEWQAGDDVSLAAMRRLTVAELMSKPVISIDAGTPAAEAAQTMLAKHIHRLVVTELERPVGIVAVSDLIGSLASEPAERGTVEQVMSRGLVVCRSSTAIGAVARVMRDRHSRSLVVVNAHGRPLGVVTGFDLLPFFAAGDPSQPVETIMHAPVTITPQASLRTAADIMLRERVHRLVVMDPAEPDSMPLGLISTADIVLEMATPGAVWRVRGRP